MHPMKFCNYYSVLITFLLFLDYYAISEIYRVGDDGGWNSGTGINYLTWSEKYNFTVGDILVFKYSKSQHNVKEVSDATYRSCVASSGVSAIYESGNDEIRVGEARKYNFICDVEDHCIGGMRFSINVLQGSNGNNTTPPSEGQSSASVTVRRKVVHSVGIVVLILIMFIHALMECTI